MNAPFGLLKVAVSVNRAFARIMVSGERASGVGSPAGGDVGSGVGVIGSWACARFESLELNLEPRAAATVAKADAFKILFWLIQEAWVTELL